jgi:poly(3-hydroxybutyrate) depolymerase
MRQLIPILGLALVALLAAAAPAGAVSVADFKPFTYTADGLTTGYRLYAPPGLQAKTRYPLIIFLHGHGERGSDNDAQLAGECQGSWSFLSTANQAKQKCFFMAPQCTVEIGWTDDKRKAQVAAIVAELIAKQPIDADRVYLTGISGGGGGTLSLMASHGSLFACAIPQSGWGSGNYEAFKDVPLWCFHAADDPVVGVKGSDDAIAGLVAAGGDPIYTRYATGGHGIWRQAYQTPPLFDWMVSQRRGHPAKTFIDFPETAKQPAAVSGATLALKGTLVAASGATTLEWQVAPRAGGTPKQGAIKLAPKWSATGIPLDGGADLVLRLLATGTSWSQTWGGATTFSRTCLLAVAPAVGK